MTFDIEQYVWLAKLLDAYGPYCEEGALDSDTPAETSCHWWPDEALEQWYAELDRLLPELDRLDPGAQDTFMRQQMVLPAGDTYANWFRYLRQHVTDFYPHRDPQTLRDDGLVPPRASRFTDKDTANRAATEVLRVHADRLRDWAATPDGTYRLHLYADLDRPVGHYLLPAEVAAYRDSGSPELQPTRYPATGCVVLMRRQPDDSTPYIAAAYPDKTLDPTARAQYPDLPLLFGGYWGQDVLELDTDRWNAERNLNIGTTDPVRDRVADQLTQLLAHDDDTLRTTVDALGSYTQPHAIRRWVTGIHRRMTRLTWNR